MVLAGDSMDLVTELIRTVLRFFYDSNISDEELADRMKVVLKDVQRSAARLKEDKLLKSESRQEMRQTDMKLVNKTYYYIDPQLFIDVVKYKILMMKRRLEDIIKNELESKGYRCPRCQKAYTVLEIQGLLNLASSAFECEICGAEIEEHTEDTVKVKATQETLSLFSEQTVPIVRFDHMEYLKQRQAYNAAMASMPEEAKSSAESLAPSVSAESNNVNLEIQIETEETKPVHNALPSWYTHSTVTGELVQETNKTAASPIADETSLDQSISVTSQIEQYYERMSTPAKRSASDLESYQETVQVEDEQMVVTVAGQPKPLSLITDEDKEKMSPDEYASYYEAYMQSIQ